MPNDLAAAFALIEAELAAASAHPLSTRKTLLVAVLIDNFADRAFAAWRGLPERVFWTEDVLAFRDGLRERSPALGLIFELCALAPGGPRLETRAVEVPIADYHKLSIEDYMVSLYNRHTVQRVLITAPGDGDRPALEVLGEAVAWWRASGLLG
ncbi:MAG: hypothetical protein P4M09_27685 [Devosia sp.]|nr:hypothetical protein [Devosia sp.]